jgi:hypothetical protein
MAINMNNFLLSKWNGDNFGIRLNTLTDVDRWVHGPTFDSYLFLERELQFTNSAEWRHAKNRGLIRHVKPYAGKWLDYVVKKNFDTLEEWLNDCNASVDDVAYGVNRVHKGMQPKFVKLKQLLDKLGYVEPPAEDDSFTHILIDVLNATKDVPVQGQRCLVKRPDGSIVISRVVDLRFCELDCVGTKLAISVPLDREGWFKDYTHMSQLPKDMVVYVRNTDGVFSSIQDMMA